MRFIPQYKRLVSSKIFHLIFYIGLFLFIFSFNYTLPLDPDLGWHLRYGKEVVVNKNILTVDTFSYPYKGQSVIDTEWLAEAVFYLIFTRFSFLGLAFISALFTSLAFFIPIVVIPANLYLKFLFIVWAVVGSSPILGVGARAQNVSLVFFGLVFVILLKFIQSKKGRYIIFLPALFFVWARAHPGFFVGFMLFSVVLFIELFFTIFQAILNWKRDNTVSFNKSLLPVFFLIIIFCTSILAINIGDKNEIAGKFLSVNVFKTLALPSLVASQTPVSGAVRKTISEWKPPLLVDLPGTLFFLGIIYSVAIFIKRSIFPIEVKYLILLLGFVYFSTLSRRNVPYFFLVFLPIAIPYTQDLLNKIILTKLIPLLTLLTLIIMIFISFGKISKDTKGIFEKGYSIDSYCQAMKYPCQAIEFIKRTKPSGNMFNHYNWGGYLIWQLPEYPVFIDGRIPGSNPFAEFETVNALRPGWEEILEKYKVEWMIMPKNLLFKELITLDGNWVEKYSDEIAVIYMKK